MAIGGEEGGSPGGSHLRGGNGHRHADRSEVGPPVGEIARLIKATRSHFVNLFHSGPNSITLFRIFRKSRNRKKKFAVNVFLGRFAGSEIILC